MKRIYSLLVFIACTLLITSCEDFMDVHKEYMKAERSFMLLNRIQLRSLREKSVFCFFAGHIILQM